MRLLAPHEYTQIAGRAGRRGIDEVGKVWLCVNLFDPPPIYDFQNMLSGKPQTLVSKFKISFSMCLSMVSSTDNKSASILQFAQKSLINNDINKEAAYYDKTIEDINILLKTKLEQYKNIKTDKAVMESYVSKKKNTATVNNNKRKKINREISSLEEDNVFIKEEVKIVDDIEYYNSEIAKNTTFKNNTCNYLTDKITSSVNLLTKTNFVTNIDGNLELTKLGQIASQFNEIHPLVLSTIVCETNYFKEFDVFEIIGILAIFTNVNVEDSLKILIPDTNSKLVNITSVKLNKVMDEFYDLEQTYNIYSGSNYERNFNIQQNAIDWCKTDDEVECKKILHLLISEKGIFLGDFIKALLKINNIANELHRAAEAVNNIELLEKINTIPSKTLKYVATNQSLYI